MKKKPDECKPDPNNDVDSNGEGFYSVSNDNVLGLSWRGSGSANEISFGGGGTLFLQCICEGKGFWNLKKPK